MHGSRLVRLTLLTAFFSSLLLPASTIADHWPSWRGPYGNGISDEANPPETWSRTENVLWRLPLPGPAGSTPAIWGDRIFLTSAKDSDLLLLCATTDGKLLWQQKVSSGNEKVRGDEGNFASPSPSTDGTHVWAFMANGVLACFDLDGNEVWKADMQDRYGKFDIQFGMSSTPLLVDDRIFVQLIHGTWNKNPSRALVVALDKETGEEIWKHVRATDAVDECKHSYASPVLYRDGTQAFLITHGADYVIAHHLDSGKEIWRCGNLNPKGTYNETLRFVASPAAVPGLIVVPTAKRGKVVGIRPGGKGDITESREFVSWVLPRNTPDVPSPLIHDGLVYLCRENGNLMALDAESGKLLYEKRTDADRHRASPVYAGGKIYVTSRRGVVTVIKAGREFEKLGQNDIGEPITASPVILDGRVYLRSHEALYAIGAR